ncbi:type I 3-dehydroquinate dehydratase [Candidatus Daviesbacteria bacterium]|nr:type I 3-dehydroquinate dehydratase [Candidatus Daviesbacteria bacterium]
MMKIKYCLPIRKNKKDEVLKIIAENPEYDFYEIWLDYIEDLDAEFVKILLTEYDQKLIFVFRRNNLEEENMDFANRKKYIEMLNGSKAYLDLDIEAQKDEVKFLTDEKLNVSLIASYHNYEETPEYEKLDKIVTKMMEINPAVYKISTYCNSQEDALALLKVLLALNKEEVKKIILGMGENGLITRIFGTLWDNEMVFAPLKAEEASAEGQMTKRDLETIFERIENAG